MRELSKFNDHETLFNNPNKMLSKIHFVFSANVI